MNYEKKLTSYHINTHLKLAHFKNSHHYLLKKETL